MEKNIVLNCLLIISFLFISCNEYKIKRIQVNTFINEKGIYYINENRIIVKEFDNGSLTYGVVDNRSNTLYQLGILNSFSKKSNWLLYVDFDKNIWFYNSDYQFYSVLLKNKTDNNYAYKEIIYSKDSIPKDLKERIKNKKKIECYTFIQKG